MSSNSINGFITDVYSTVVDTSKWMEILNQTAGYAGAKAANACLVDYVTEELNSQFMCTETDRFYPIYTQSPHMETELKAVSRLSQLQTTTDFYETGDFVNRANEVFVEDPIDLSESEDWLHNEWNVRNQYKSKELHLLYESAR